MDHPRLLTGFGSLLLLGGRLSDIVGRRRTLLIGLGGFAAASAVGGAATGFGMLAAARAFQGAFAAVLAPAALSLLTSPSPTPNNAERRWAFTLGVGMGLTFAPAIATATAGITGEDAGVASAMVNTSQQIGGAIGTAALSTIFVSAGRSWPAR